MKRKVNESRMTFVKAHEIGQKYHGAKKAAGWGSKAGKWLAAQGIDGVHSEANLDQYERMYLRWPRSKAELADSLGISIRYAVNLVAFDPTPEEVEAKKTDDALRLQVEEKLELQDQLFRDIKAGLVKGNQIRKRISMLRKLHANLLSPGEHRLLSLRDHRATRDKIKVLIEHLRASKALLLQDSGRVSPELQKSLNDQLKAVEGQLEALTALLKLLDDLLSKMDAA